MQNILIIHFGSVCECLISTSLIKGFQKIDKDTDIHFVVNDKECLKVFQYNKDITSCMLYSDFIKSQDEDYIYDKVINLHPSFDPRKIKSKEFYGFNTDKDTEKIDNILYGKNSTNKSIFQLYFNLAGLKWKGEGYNFQYFPKTKNKIDWTGVAIANINLRNYIVNKLKLENSKLHIVPFKNNIYTKFDELNKYYNIITDDFLTLNIALCLRKSIYFLETSPYNFKLEMFGEQQIIKVPKFHI